MFTRPVSHHPTNRNSDRSYEQVRALGPPGDDRHDRSRERLADTLGQLVFAGGAHRRIVAVRTYSGRLRATSRLRILRRCGCWCWEGPSLRGGIWLSSPSSAGTTSRSSTAARPAPVSSPSSSGCGASGRGTSRDSAACASTRSSTRPATCPPMSSARRDCSPRRAGRYLFVSSRSVYADHSVPGANEDSPIGELPEGAPDDAVTAESYGPLKARCEQAVWAAFGDRTVILRPGLIVGPHDPTGRFTYWPQRIAEGGDVLAPEPPDQPIQVVDVRDLAAFALDLLERGAGGTFDVVSPAGMLTLGGVIDACRRGEHAPSRKRSGWRRSSCSSAASSRGARSRCGRRATTSPASSARTSPAHLPPACTYGRSPRRWPTPCAGHGSTTHPAGDALTREREAELLAEWRAADRGGSGAREASVGTS